jgi:hypothetical protein
LIQSKLLAQSGHIFRSRRARLTGQGLGGVAGGKPQQEKIDKSYAQRHENDLGTTSFKKSQHAVTF